MEKRELEGKVTGFTASENVVGSEKESEYALGQVEAGS